MKQVLTIIGILSAAVCFGQWDIATGNVDWTPDNSSSPNVLPLATYNHAVNITASVDVTISGGGNVGDPNDYPLCPSTSTKLTFSLSGGASFIGTNAADAVTSSGDWKSRFSWSYFDASKTSIIATQTSTIPTNTFPGTSNNFVFQVLTPNYSSTFTFATSIVKGTGNSACRVHDGFPDDRNPDTDGNNNAQSINGFTNRSLPIQSLDFNSIDKQTNGIKLNWKTLNEQNTLEFEIERKYSNEETWMTIGKTPAAGQSSKELTYAYSDATYAQRDKIYYRIKQVDMDGTFTYTDIKGIELKKNSQVKLDGYPNPVKDLYHLTITGAKDDKVSIDIYDILGRSVSRKTLSIVKGANYHDLNMGTYTPGTYIVRVSSAEINESMTVVKVD